MRDDEELAYAVAVMVLHLDELYPWRRDALCREPEYADGINFLDDHQADVARAVCARCLVRAECNAHAALGDVAGVCGGLTVRERRELARGPRPVRIRKPQVKAKRARCDGCGGGLPFGRVGLCCECEDADRRTIGAVVGSTA